MAQRIKGFLTENKPTHTDTVMRIEKGDIVLLRNEYLEVDGFFRTHKGKLCMRLGIPQEREKFRHWAQKNPHKVKHLETCTTLL